MNRAEFGRKIKQKRESMDESQEVFGKRFEVSQQAVVNWEAGETLPSKRILPDVCSLIGVQFEDVAALRRVQRHIITVFKEPFVKESSPTYKANVAPSLEDRRKPIPIPVISWVQAGDWEYAADPYQPGQADHWMTSTVARSQYSFALVVKGDSMEPEFCEGDIVVVDPEQDAGNKDFVVAKNGLEATFKQLVMDGDRTYLKPLNPRYPVLDAVGFRVVGVVVEKRKRYK